MGVLPTNHIHLIAVPKSEEGLRQAIGEAHRRYARQINFRERWRGHLWQGRFASFPIDERYLLTASRYVELNPVRAKLVEIPETYKWSSAMAHLNKQDDELVKVFPLGRPLGGEKFVAKIEKALGRMLHRQKPGPKQRTNN